MDRSAEAPPKVSLSVVEPALPNTIFFEFESKLPPSCGVVSSTISLIPPPTLVKPDPSPLNAVAVIVPTASIPPPRTLIPDLAVTIPIESILVTSS